MRLRSVRLLVIRLLLRMLPYVCGVASAPTSTTSAVVASRTIAGPHTTSSTTIPARATIAASVVRAASAGDAVGDASAAITTSSAVPAVDAPHATPIAAPMRVATTLASPTDLTSLQHRLVLLMPGHTLVVSPLVVVVLTLLMR